ncbi:MAG: diguanylate cyclase [Nitrospirae bacterium]|nr:MAG: diguanylate cyclase [Nitrospirota bacterium]
MKDFIRESEFLQTLVDAVPSLLFIVDRDVRIFHYNRAAAQLLEKDRETVLMSKGGDVLQCLHSYESPGGCGGTEACSGCTIRNSVGGAFVDQQTAGEPTAMKILRNGTVEDVIFMVTTVPLNYKDERYALLVLDDVTKQKKTEEELLMVNKLLEHQAVTDPLTGIYNRLKFDEMLMNEINRSKRHKLPLSLVMFDIDHFKKVNDTYGHHIGDAVLQQLTSHISRGIRKHDCFARWGGEEFMIMLTHNTLEAAMHFTEHIRKEIEELRIRGLQKITCSFGVTQLNEQDDIFSFTKRADDALYRAKSRGRNRVETLTVDCDPKKGEK